MSTISKRRNYIKQFVDISTAKIIEIGASNAPTFQKKESNIFFMDWFSYEELFKEFEHTRPERAKKLVDVDFVIKDNNFSNHIDEQFDLVIANHVVEHIPDLIRWFAQVKKILKPDGFLFLAIPHKEYTFDKIKPISTTVNLLECYDKELTAPTLYQVFEHIHLYRPIKGKDVWNNNYQHLLEKPRFSIKESMKRAIHETTTKPYVDVHCHVFTTESWQTLIKELHQLDKLYFKIISVRDVYHDGNEFFSIMTIAESSNKL
jgi:SAM-dependent methyltransferase